MGESGNKCQKMLNFPIKAKLIGRGEEMTGRFYHTLDAKGRLFIPTRLREELGESFHVTISIEKTLDNSTENYLTAYSQASWDKFMENFHAMPRNDRNKIRPLMSRAQPCELDGQGRILLPPHLREWGKFKKNITIVGFGDCAQIWDSDTFAVIDEVETSPESLAGAMEALGI